MIEVEFQAKVQNDIIAVPEEYQSDFAEVEQVKCDWSHLNRILCCDI